MSKTGSRLYNNEETTFKEKYFDLLARLDKLEQNNNSLNVQTNGSIKDLSMKADNFIIKYIPKPKILTLNIKEVEKLLNKACPDNKLLIEFILSKYKSNKLETMIYNEVIRPLFVVNNENRTFWIIDSFRNNFLISTEKGWEKDINGVNFKKLIIDPIVKLLRRIIHDYTQSVCDYCETNYDDIDSVYMYYTQQKQETCMKIIEDMNDQTLHKDLLKSFNENDFYLNEEIRREILNLDN